MNVMTIAETNSYLSGQDRRARQGWEQTRLLGGLIYKVLTGDDWECPFPWDEKSEEVATSPEEMARLRAMAREVEKSFNAKGNL